jgi:hypothetical protein
MLRKHVSYLSMATNYVVITTSQKEILTMHTPLKNPHGTQKIVACHDKNGAINSQCIKFHGTS